jgi:two-component system NtrC family sensor kinase
MRLFPFQRKIFLHFSLAIVLIGVLMVFLGTHLISNTVRREAQDRVTMDLRSARYVYNTRIESIRLALELMSESISDGDIGESWDFLNQKREELGLDFLSLCDADGKVTFRSCPPHLAGDERKSNPLIRKALRGESAGGTVILPREVLQREGERLAERAYISFIPTPRAKPRREKAETSGMCLMSAVPVKDRSSGKIIGVLYGGVLLNRNYALVDGIRDIIFKEKTYKGKEFGTVTIFQWDVRIATNVLRENGERAIGTRVSEEVYNCVLEHKKPWLERAFVVHDWYISAYEPIFNPDQEVIGVLYVGILEDKYNDIRNGILLNFFPPLGAGILIVLFLSYLLSRDLSRPVHRLVLGTERIALGDLDYRIQERSGFREIEQLTEHFNQMAQALKEREEQLEKTNEDLRRVNRNYMEMLGFVSHEIKNALANILGSAYNLRDGYTGELNDTQKRVAGIIVRNCERLRDMIKNYLDLSRIEKGELEARKQEVDFAGDVLPPVIDELRGQLESKGMRLVVHVPTPYRVKADPDLLKIIMENLLSNAIKYGREGGEIRITADEDEENWRISVWNEGEGIPERELPRLFSKFTRLKTESSKKGRGSGLGLFITKEMVEKQGGKIWAESEFGRWAMFSFILPKRC